MKTLLEKNPQFTEALSVAMMTEKLSNKIELEYGCLVDILADLEDTKYGILQKGNTGYFININRKLPRLVRLIALGHEAGHLYDCETNHGGNWKAFVGFADNHTVVAESYAWCFGAKLLKQVGFTQWREYIHYATSHIRRFDRLSAEATERRIWAEVNNA